MVYDARVRPRFATLLIVALFAMPGWAQENASLAKSSHADNAKSEPKYDQTFSGPIVELTTTKITVSRSILGKPAEKRTFWIKADTRIEGKLQSSSESDRRLYHYRRRRRGAVGGGANVEEVATSSFSSWRPSLLC